MSTQDASSEKPRVLIAGGGIAGLEAALALADLAGDQADLLCSPPNPTSFTSR